MLNNVINRDKCIIINLSIILCRLNLISSIFSIFDIILQLIWKYNTSGMRKRKCVLRRANLIIMLFDREVREILMIAIALCTIKKKSNSVYAHSICTLVGIHQHTVANSPVITA